MAQNFKTILLYSNLVLLVLALIYYSTRFYSHLLFAGIKLDYCTMLVVERILAHLLLRQTMRFLQ